MKLSQLFAKAVTRRIQFWKVFKVASRHKHQIKDNTISSNQKNRTRKSVMTKNVKICQNKTKQALKYSVSFKTISII